ncbi:hypothetical protein Pan216_02990 [Planctomycetes bacterium Pan216]|uniref:Collagen-binding domain-containing protein n=1 Tax=Kolteria novifilia TaxID=2527975 RepID=A0A518AXM1_9BACT|nr:hypothetical protein Pan216_02990 [Planctomycetes bacterium Pan216]
MIVRFVPMLLLLGCSVALADEAANRDRIQPYAKNPHYWQYKGKPVLLLGGTIEDNLFQLADVTFELESLVQVGGNFVRNTMSSRDQGNLWPFKKVGEDYDLEQWNDEYWQRFERFLSEAAKRDVIVQLEVWATFDFYQGTWRDNNPFNPNLNSNYKPGEAKLPIRVNSHPTRTENPFFETVPGEDNNELVLKYQQRYVSKLLDHSLNYGNVLYCMDNETSVTPKWGAHWAKFIRDRAAKEGLHVETTEMWDSWDLKHESHRATFDHPELYSFVDLSQNNHQRGQRHYDNAMAIRERFLKSTPRPANNVKIYGADTGRFGRARDGVERFWRSIFAGHAAARFHRPPSGLGLGEVALQNLRAARAFTNAFTIFTCEPNNSILGQRAPNEAYALVDPGKVYALYFPARGSVTLDVVGIDAKTWSVRWFQIGTGEWKDEETATANSGRLTLQTPENDAWGVLVTPKG